MRRPFRHAWVLLLVASCGPSAPASAPVESSQPTHAPPESEPQPSPAPLNAAEPEAADGAETSASEPTETSDITEPDRIKAAHIVVAWAGSQRAPNHITRTKDEALTRISEALQRARAGESFAELAAKYSDEPGAGKRGGSLGFFTRRQMMKPFSDAAFSLSPGELSDIVETGYGYHIILRIE